MSSTGAASCSFCGREDSFIYLVCERRHLICNSCLHQQTVLKLFLDTLRKPPGKCPLCATSIAGSMEQILSTFGRDQSGNSETAQTQARRKPSVSAAAGEPVSREAARPKTPKAGGAVKGGELVEVDLGIEESMFVSFLKTFKCVVVVSLCVVSYMVC